jgi:site-specific recombinase XerD
MSRRQPRPAAAPQAPVPAVVDLAPASPQLPADRHPVAVYLARLAASSRRPMSTALQTAAQLLSGGRADAERLPWWTLHYPHMTALRSQLIARAYAPATGNRILAAVRGVLKESWRLGLMPLEQQIRACDLPPIRGSRVPKGRRLTDTELIQLFQACAADPRPTGRRDTAMLALLYGAGLRRTELVNLEVGDYDPATGALTVRQGTGNKDRQLFAGNGSAEALKAWLAVRGRHPGPLFLPLGKAGRLQHRRLTDKAVTWVLSERAAQAGVAAFSPHDLRRAYISSLLASGVDLATVAAMAGHANLTTTAKYDRRGEESKRRAGELRIIPFVAPPEAEDQAKA